MGDDVRYTVGEVISRAERALSDLRIGYPLKAVKLAKHPDVDGLYALCVTQFGLPPNHGETGTELLLSHVVEKVPCLVSKIRLAKGGHSDDLLKLSCDDFCRLDFAADDDKDVHPLAKWVRVETKGKQRRVMELLMEQSPKRLADIAIELEWQQPYDNLWNSTRRTLNNKLKRRGWRLTTHDKSAELLKNSTKMSAS